LLSSRENQFLDPQFTVDGGGSERFKVHPLAEATTSKCGVHLLGGHCDSHRHASYNGCRVLLRKLPRCVLHPLPTGFLI
jgi:hypothetical protein